MELELERASDIIANCKEPYNYDLFEHFVRLFDLTSPNQLEVFAVLCGFGLGVDVGN